MTQPLHRRGLFRSLFAALLGGSAAQAAAATSASPRCPHYYDGRLWCADASGPMGHYRHDPTGCPFCASASRVAESRAVSDSGTIVYEASGLPPGLSINHHAIVIDRGIRNGTTGTKHPPHGKAG